MEPLRERTTESAECVYSITHVPNAQNHRTLNMKKHTLPVIAAALLATPAFAQMKAPKLTWNFNGVFDVGFRSVNHGNPALDRTFLSNSNSYTTLLIGRLHADFQNGYAGIALVEIDHDPTHSNKANQSVGSNVFTGSPFQGQQYVGLVTPFGTVKLGMPNSLGLPTGGSNSNPFGTGLGSGYHAATPWARLGSHPANGVSSFVGSGTRIIRHERSMSYETPNFGGFVGQFEYAPGNDNAADGSANNNDEWLGIGGTFRRGPVSVMAFHGEARSGDRRGAGATPPSAMTQTPSVLPAGEAAKWNMVSANWKVLPPLTLYAGATSSKVGNGLDDTTSWNIGGKYTWQKFDFMANYLARSENKGAFAPAANMVPKSRLIGLGVDYRFEDSPLNAIYYRYEDIDKVNAAGQSLKQHAIGIRVGFNM
jgi:predicted porin